MKEYIFGLVLVGIIVSIAEVMCHEHLKSTTRIALGLILICATVAPLINSFFVLSEGELDEIYVEANSYGGYEEACLSAFEEGVAQAVTERFGGEVVHARCIGFDPRVMRCREVLLVFHGDAPTAEKGAVEDYVVENFTDEGRCEIEILTQ